MILSRLELANFRNYEALSLEFSEGRNIITGLNAQGKTNLLESVYFLSHLRSSRAPRMRELVKEGCETASVRGLIMDGGDRLNLKAVFGARGRTVEINGQKVENAAKGRGVLKCVLFAPEDLYIVKGDPSRRRDLFDETLEELGPVQADALLRYRHVLRQRNALLRRWEESSELRRAIAPWNEALAAAGAVLVVERRKMMEGTSDIIAEAYEHISGQKRSLSLEYAGTVEAAADEKEAESRLLEELERRLADEKGARTTVVGPHRDDMEISLGGRGARFSASQGEQRTIAFCLRVAQMSYIESCTGKRPVLLLDDVLSELDAGRRKRVLETVGGRGQSVITATEAIPGAEGGADRYFEVEAGRVSLG